MSKFYIASSKAKELCEEVKTAKEKNKELNKKVLLKKGEVIRLTEYLNRLQGIETKLKNEVGELRADFVEKETRIAYLEGQISAFNSSLDFDSFKIPLATESSLLPMSSEDVNMVDDATNEVTQDTNVASKDVPKSGGDAASGLPQ